VRELAERFEADRGHLQAVAFRMLGSMAEAEDAVQEAWIRLSRTDTSEVGNLSGWLTTVVARLCLDTLRSRRARHEEPVELHFPDPVVTAPGPEEEAELADSVGLALLVVLETMSPPERLAFVLHDLFAMPYDEIAPIAGRTTEATRQLASRARRRVQGQPVVPDASPARQREAVDAFLAAARGGDFTALLEVLDPDVVLRSDRGAAGAIAVRGRETVAAQAQTFWQYGAAGAVIRPALVNGVAGLVAFRDGKPFSVLAFTVTHGRIAAIDILADPDRLARLDLSALDSALDDSAPDEVR